GELRTWRSTHIGDLSQVSVAASIRHPFVTLFPLVQTGMEEPLLRQQRSRQEPQGKQNQPKRNEERDQQVLISLDSSRTQDSIQANCHYYYRRQGRPYYRKSEQNILDISLSDTLLLLFFQGQHRD